MLWGEIVGVHQHRGHLLNKPSRACCGPTRNLQCAVVEGRENSLWLFNQPVVALGVVCLCSTASNKWISHWQTDAGRKKKKGRCIQKLLPSSFPNDNDDDTHQNKSEHLARRLLALHRLSVSNCDSLVTCRTVDTSSLCEPYIVCCMLMAYWPCMV